MNEDGSPGTAIFTVRMIKVMISNEQIEIGCQRETEHKCNIVTYCKQTLLRGIYRKRDISKECETRFPFVGLDVCFLVL